MALIGNGDWSDGTNRSLKSLLEDEETSLVIDAEDAAKMLNMRVETIRTILRAGNFPGGKKIGGQWVITKKSLYDHLYG